MSDLDEMWFTTVYSCTVTSIRVSRVWDECRQRKLSKHSNFNDGQGVDRPRRSSRTATHDSGVAGRWALFCGPLDATNIDYTALDASGLSRSVFTCGPFRLTLGVCGLRTPRTRSRNLNLTFYGKRLCTTDLEGFYRWNVIWRPKTWRKNANGHGMRLFTFSTHLANSNRIIRILSLFNKSGEKVRFFSWKLQWRFPLSYAREIGSYVSAFEFRLRNFENRLHDSEKRHFFLALYSIMIRSFCLPKVG